MRRLKHRSIITALMIVAAFMVAVFMELYFLLIENKIPTKNLLSKNIVNVLIDNADVLRFAVIFVFFILLIIAISIYGGKRIGEIIYTFRYPISGGIFLFLIMLEIHGSSILFWQNYFKGTVNYETIIGIPRMIRSDEWAVNTPMMLSQYLNSSGAFPYFSETIRGTLTDAFIVYGQPVRDIAVLFRPFHWGYLFLPPAKGLSFFWVGRTIGLFLVSFEFAMLLTKKDKILALAYATLVTWAPIVQWWFAINGLIEMLIFGQLALIMIAFYMKNNNYLWRSFYALIIFICAGGYILTFYPSWQVPLAYVFLVLLIGVIYENWKGFNWGKKDALILTLLMVSLALGMSYVLFKSSDTIATVLGTVYPGKRFETGGGEIARFFLYPGTLFFGLSSKTLPYTNPCEWSVFFDFFPMGILLSFWVLFKEKKRDIYLIAMMILAFILTLWCVHEWPAWLAKITLLNYTQAIRASLAIGLLNILLLIRALALMETLVSKWIAIVGSILLGISMTLIATHFYEGYISTKMAIVIFFVLISSFYIIFNGNKVWAKRIFLGISLAVTFISGMFINPVSSGVDVIYKQALIKEIQQIKENDNGLWIVDSGDVPGMPIINIPLMAGAPTINSSNVYPDLERWALLDPDKSSEDIYNRYAHISINLTDADTKSSFDLTSPDGFTVKLNVEDLDLLGVRYILTTRQLDEMATEQVSFREVTSTDGFYIYQIEYN